VALAAVLEEDLEVMVLAGLVAMQRVWVLVAVVQVEMLISQLEVLVVRASSRSLSLLR
jgi:hypothetical protein